MIHEIDAGDDVAAVCASGAAGDTYVFDHTGGPHRVTGPLTLRNGDTWTSHEPYGARLTGSVAVTGWTKDGARWVASVPSYAEKANSELFYSTVELPKRRQASQSAVGPGAWYYDTAANKVWVGDDPSSAEVELSIAKRIIHTNATDLLIENLIIEKATNGKQEGMIHSTNEPQANWTLRYLDVRYSNGTGYRQPGGLSTATRCRFRYHSQMNVVGGSDTPGAGLFFCELAYGNYFVRYSIGHEAGSIKIVGSSHFTVANCWTHHNQGPGIWFDINNYQYLIENCLAEDERWMGIYCEIGHDGIIRNNLVRRCAKAIPASDGLWDVVWAGISAAASHDVEMVGNVVEDCPQGYIGFQQNRAEYQPEADEPYHNPNHWSGSSQTYSGDPHCDGSHRVWNLNVHGNTYATPNNGHCGIASDAGGDSLLDLTRTNEQNNNEQLYPYCKDRQGSNRWSGNAYYIGDGNQGHGAFFWNQGNQHNWAEWQALGQDAGGSYASWAAYTPSTWTRPPGWEEDGGGNGGNGGGGERPPRPDRPDRPERDVSVVVVLDPERDEPA